MNKNKKTVSVDRLAKLANLKITSKEKAKIGPQLEETVSYFAILSQAKNIDKEKPTFQVTNNINITAEDKIKPCLSKQKILGKKNYFTVLE